MSIVLKRRGEDITEINPVTTGPAPDFNLADQNGNVVQLSKLTKPVLISVFPNINTPVCSLQTRRFNQEAAKHEEIEFLSISNNTAAEQQNWCASEGVEMKILADGGQFGSAYGLLMESGELAGKLARSIFVIKNGEITYAEIVSDLSNEPDYEAALKACQE